MRWPVLLFLVVASALLPAVGYAVEDVDRRTGREVITGQLDAFRRDDAGAAFGFASPGIRQLFATEDAFLDMVRRAYPPVYRPRSFAFGEVRDLADGFEQSVTIQDESGASWDAVYTFERQPDGTWKISACRLIKRPEETA
jgi:hypothetical protein